MFRTGGSLEKLKVPSSQPLRGRLGPAFAFPQPIGGGGVLALVVAAPAWVLTSLLCGNENRGRNRGERRSAGKGERPRLEFVRIANYFRNAAFSS